MRNNKDRRNWLDQQSTPIAILHEGMYAYANPAFLDLFGYQRYSDIEGIPALDMAVSLYRDRLRNHLKQAAVASLDTHSLPSTRLLLTRRDETHIAVTATSHSTTFDGEQCIEIWLQPYYSPTHYEAPRQKKQLLTLPWRPYLSLAFLVIFTLFPPVLLLKLNINNDPKVYFPDDEPAVVIDKALREQFPNDQAYILLFEGANLFSDNFLKAYHQLAQRLEKHSPRGEGVWTHDPGPHLGQRGRLPGRASDQYQGVDKDNTVRAPTKRCCRSLCQKCPGCP